VYHGIDWNTEAYSSTLKALSTVIITLAFFLMVRGANRIKYYLNGLSRKISKANLAEKL
jgi:hypothetical protein